MPDAAKDQIVFTVTEAPKYDGNDYVIVEAYAPKMKVRWRNKKKYITSRATSRARAIAQAVFELTRDYEYHVEQHDPLNVILNA